MCDIVHSVISDNFYSGFFKNFLKIIYKSIDSEVVLAEALLTNVVGFKSV